MFSTNLFLMSGGAYGEMKTSFMIVMAILMIWTLFWKGLALWKAANNGNKAWFIVLLVINTLGILEIIYYFFLDKNCKCEEKCECCDRSEDVENKN